MPSSYAFQDNSRGNPSSWQWGFGNGTGAGTQDTTQAYASAGALVTKLTVIGPTGTSVVRKVVPVSPGNVSAFGPYTALNGALLAFPCLAPGGSLCYCPSFIQDIEIALTGSATAHNVTLRVAGVAAGVTCTGGSQGPGWYIGGSGGFPGGLSPSFILRINSTDYTLNPNAGPPVQSWDYTNVLSIPGNATITFSGLTTGTQLPNPGLSVVNAITPQPFNGQFFQVQVLSVV